MPLVSLRQVLDHAAENGYGVPAFNVNNLEQIQAILEAARRTQSPVILQASAGARKYAGEVFLVEGELGCLGSLESGMAGEEDGSGAEGTLARPRFPRSGST